MTKTILTSHEPWRSRENGFHKVRTLLRFTIDGREIKDLEVIELGKR